MYNGKHGLQEPGEGIEPVYLSEAARLLIDFNPGLLSTIAVAFREKMLQNEAKRLESANYGLEFPVTFTGKETVVWNLYAFSRPCRVSEIGCCTFGRCEDALSNVAPCS